MLYLVLFLAPQVLVFLYLRERLSDPTRPRSARIVRRALAAVFLIANLPWIAVADRVLVGRFWSIGRIPYIAPFVAWQAMGWVLCALIALYVLGKGVVGTWGRGRRGIDISAAHVPPYVRAFRDLRYPSASSPCLATTIATRGKTTWFGCGTRGRSSSATARM